MTSEREGLRQIESAIRQVQAIVDGSGPNPVAAPLLG